TGKVDRQEGREVDLFSSDSAARWDAVSFLNPQRIAIVEGQSIAPLLNHRPDPPGGDPARERASRVAGAAVFAIARVPPIPDNAAPGGISSPKLLSLARSVQWVTLAARPEGNSVRISLEGECETPTDARALQSTLEVFRLIGASALESAKTRQSMDPATWNVLDSMLKNAEIDASAERVRILVELGPEILKLGEARKPQP
ncbi:MAG: hypothetical protein ACRD4Y_16155, partial [Candidatus Acidiferrales bacterium]